MSIKEMREQTGLSQSKFAGMFDIPVATLKDWEQGRRNPPSYVISMIKTILEGKGLLANIPDPIAGKEHRKSMERALSILYTATNKPDQIFMDVLNSYIFGKVSLEELNAHIDRLECLEV